MKEILTLLRNFFFLNVLYRTFFIYIGEWSFKRKCTPLERIFKYKTVNRWQHAGHKVVENDIFACKIWSFSSFCKGIRFEDTKHFFSFHLYCLFLNKISETFVAKGQQFLFVYVSIFRLALISSVFLYRWRRSYL